MKTTRIDLSLEDIVNDFNNIRDINQEQKRYQLEDKYATAKGAQKVALEKQLQEISYETEIRDDEFHELYESVRQFGIINPLLVKKIGSNSYKLLAGFRRYTVAQELGLDTVPVVIVEEASELNLEALKLVENFARKDMSAVQITYAVEKIHSIALKEGKDIDYVASIIGMSKEKVKQYLSFISDSRYISILERNLASVSALSFISTNSTLSNEAKDNMIKSIINKGEKVNVEKVKKDIEEATKLTTENKLPLYTEVDKNLTPAELNNFSNENYVKILLKARQVTNVTIQLSSIDLWASLKINSFDRKNIKSQLEKYVNSIKK